MNDGGYGSGLKLLMQEYVQKLTSTTFPRNAESFSGPEFSQSTAPSKPSESAFNTVPPIAKAEAANRFLRVIIKSRPRR
ncbi:MAG: hypothetical protein WDO18_19365 [Acidobacteriota bacterium]